MYKYIGLLASLTCVLLACAKVSFAETTMPAKNQVSQSPGLKIVESASSGDAEALVKQGQRVWEPEVRDMATWKQLSKPIRDAEYSKFVVDIKSGKIYFVDANVFTLHIDFVMDFLQKLPRTPANVKAYNKNYSIQKPQFILGYLTHYPNQNTWTFSFWEGDYIQARAIANVAILLKQHFKISALKFRPDSSYQERVADDLSQFNVPVIKNATIYQSMPYQAFTVGQSVGQLTIVPKQDDLQNVQFNQQDIVVLQQSYPDITPVSGIITTQFSTPLSHVNLRANAWGIPNASLKTAVQDFAHLNGKWVKLTVDEQVLTLVAATAKEEEKAKETFLLAKQIKLPDANLKNKALNTLSVITLPQITSYGAKTAHLGEMKQSKLPVPNGFGVPFYYYQHHIKLHGLDNKIKKIVSDDRFSDPVWRKAELMDLQKAILDAPMNRADFLAIEKQWQKVLKGAPVFARSSTNAEDLKGFNGAGLYDTVPNIKSSDALEMGIKKVWASLWNVRAVDERTFFGISQQYVYAGVLVQHAVNANASGVLLTTDIWGHQTHTFTINAKWGLGMRVVDGQKIAEQILYDTSNNGARVISRSDESTMLVLDDAGGIKEVNVPTVEAIVTEKRAKQLGQLAKKIEQIFPQYKIIDIEWVLEKEPSGNDRFWIVQARPYVGK
jgi:pyruvate, water dikinase